MSIEVEQQHFLENTFAQLRPKPLQPNTVEYTLPTGGLDLADIDSLLSESAIVQSAAHRVLDRIPDNLAELK